MEPNPSQGLPDSYDFSQSQFTQTQPQTQPDTQPHSTAFPAHLWGILLSSSASADASTVLLDANRADPVANLDRPTRFEFVRPSFGGKATYTIGRHPKNDLRLNSPKVSNSHARITISDEDGLVRLEDLSTNGTFVRGAKVSPSTVPALPRELEMGNATEIQQSRRCSSRARL